jgi:methylated-DNA-protein-cysteine methyltransferase-like protein
MKSSFTFAENVYDVVRLIPFGRVSTYGAIANYLGAKKSARLVGYAMNNSHQILPVVPAHRVVNRFGLLTGKHFFGTENEMQRRLELEGIEVKNDCIQHFKKVFWDPTIECAL